jgi:hypothetical protein
MPQPFLKPLFPARLFPRPPFPELRERLLRAGIAPRHVRRYLSELSDHLADLTAEEQRLGLSPSAARTAALHRLGTTDTLAEAMLAQPRLQSLSARAPWAVFTLSPLLLLAALWLLSLCLLRLGWHLFMPQASTPFGNAYGPHTLFDPRNIYFQLDRALYLGAPILAGWCMTLTAARQRLKALWPIVSLALLALLAATSHVQANRLAIPSGLGHIRVDFALRPAPQNEYAVVVLLFALAPYLLWNLQTRRTLTTSH